jgi:hypothetical protein
MSRSEISPIALPRVWHHYRQHPKEIKERAAKNYALPITDPRHLIRLGS